MGNESAKRRTAAEATIQSKFDAFGIPAAYHPDRDDFCHIPFVRGSKVQLCCQMEKLIPSNDLLSPGSVSAESSSPGSSHVLIARVSRAYVHPSMYRASGAVDIETHQGSPSVGRVGLDHFIIAEPSRFVDKPPPHRPPSKL